MIAATTLTDVLGIYLLERRLRENSQYQLARIVGRYSEWLGRCATLADLDDQTVSRWLACEEGRLGGRTVADCRGGLLRLWRLAADHGLVDAPRRVRRCPKPAPMPIAWTLAELRTLVAVCSIQRGCFRDGRPRALYLVTLAHSAYDTGLRRSDLWSLDRRQVRPDGTVLVRQSKTGQPHAPRLRETALEGFRQLAGEKPLRCPYRHAGSFGKLWRGLVRLAHVRPGCLQQIRRTGASHLAIDHPEAVQRYLGHRTAEMQRHYVDESIARPVGVLPPEL